MNSSFPDVVIQVPKIYNNKSVHTTDIYSRDFPFIPFGSTHKQKFDFSSNTYQV